MADAGIVGDHKLCAPHQRCVVAERCRRKNHSVGAGLSGEFFLALARKDDGLNAEIAQLLDEIIEVGPAFFLAVVLASCDRREQGDGDQDNEGDDRLFCCLFHRVSPPLYLGDALLAEDALRAAEQNWDAAAPEDAAARAGELLFAAVNAIRLAGVDAEEALTFASKRFRDELLAPQAGANGYQAETPAPIDRK